MKVTDVIPKFSQYEGISYAGDFNCPQCDKSGFFDFQWENREKPNLIGWCETNIGYMAIFECPICFEKFRFHCTIGTWEDYAQQGYPYPWEANAQVST